jgi:chemotaxis protein CheD
MRKTAAQPRLSADGLRQIFLQPGGLYCSAESAVIRTVLGSCVAVCLVDRFGRGAGMNHYVLPSNPGGQPSLRYGDVAIEQLILKLSRLGCNTADLRAKVFGGAAVLPFGAPEDTVGNKNVAIALEWLRLRSIPVVARRTGGENGLLVRLYTASGRVMVRPIVATSGRLMEGRNAVHDSRLADAAVSRESARTNADPGESARTHANPRESARTNADRGESARTNAGPGESARTNADLGRSPRIDADLIEN